MKAYLINPTARTVTAFEFSGLPSDLAKIINGGEHAGIGLTSDESPDVVFVGRHVPDDAGFFFIKGIPMPLGGLAVVMGCNHVADVREGRSAGTARAPTATLEDIRKSVLWLKRIGEDAFGADLDGNDAEGVKNALAIIASFGERAHVEHIHEGRLH